MRSIPDHPTQLQAVGELQQYPQWVNFIFVSRGTKITKPPINPSMPEFPPCKERLADTTNPATWASYETAIATWKASETYQGVGFVFTAQDPFCGIDLDDCIDPMTRVIAPWARRILRHLNSYSEISARGTGIHIYVRANLEATRLALSLTDLKHKKNAVEIYDRERYFTWTGRHMQGTPTSIQERQDQISTLYTMLFSQEETEQQHVTVIPPVSTSHIQLPEDSTLLERAARGRNGTKFTRLWGGDTSAYRRPDSDEPDSSQADLALCSILAYWTRRDAARIDHLFRQSGLYRPEKWDRPARSGETYGEGTIRIAIAHCHHVYDPAWRPPGHGNNAHAYPQERGVRA